MSTKSRFLHFWTLSDFSCCGSVRKSCNTTTIPNAMQIWLIVLHFGYTLHSHTSTTHLLHFGYTFLSHTITTHLVVKNAPHLLHIGYTFFSHTVSTHLVVKNAPHLLHFGYHWTSHHYPDVTTAVIHPHPNHTSLTSPDSTLA